jgi:hypothetical protein
MYVDVGNVADSSEVNAASIFRGTRWASTCFINNIGKSEHWDLIREISDSESGKFCKEVNDHFNDHRA